MILIFLHGPPAVGKYTIGRELAALTGFELFHNHLVVDEVLQRHPFGSLDFVDERDTRWREFLGNAAADSRRRIIFTFNPESSVPQDFIDWLFGELARQGVVVHSVALVSKDAEIESRLATPERQQFKKLTDLALYRQLRASGTFLTPVIPRTDLTIDTGRQTAPEAATAIRDHFNLS